MATSYSRSVESLSEPVRREFEKLQQNLQDAAERHLHEQQFLMIGFLEDMLRLERHGESNAPRAWPNRRSPTPGHRNSAPSGLTESAVRTGAPAPATRISRLRPSEDTLGNLQSHVPMTEDEDCVSEVPPPRATRLTRQQKLEQEEREWLATLEKKDKPARSCKTMAATEEGRAKMKLLAMTNTQLLTAPLLSWCEWWAGLKEPPRQGPVARVVQSIWFQCLTLAVIFANCAYIWLEHDQNWLTVKSEGDFHTGLLLFFVSYYCVELGLNLYVHRLYFFVAKDAGWNVLDFVLILFSLVDAVNRFAFPDRASHVSLGFARVMRLLKVGRLLALLKALTFVGVVRVTMDCLAETSLLWCGQLSSSGSLWSSLQCTLLRQWATTLTATSEKLIAFFGSNSLSALSLFKACSAGEPWGPQYDLIAETGAGNGALYFIFILFFQVCVWNVFTSIVVQKGMQLSTSDRDDQLVARQRQQQKQSRMLLELCRQADIDKSGKMSLAELLQCMQQKDFRKTFAQLGFDPSDAELLFDVLGNHNEEVDFTEFIRCCTRMKGMASSLDLHVLQHHVQLMEANQHKFMNFCLRRLTGITDRLQVAEELTRRSPGAVQAVQQDIAALTLHDPMLS